MTRIAIGIVVLMLIGASCNGNGGAPIARPTAEPPEVASTLAVALSPTAIGAGPIVSPTTTQGDAQPTSTPQSPTTTPAPASTATPGPTPKSAAFTGTGDIPTRTVAPTVPPEPTATDTPTAMPKPTATDTPRVTPKPTATDTPTSTPDPTQQPIIVSGVGDDLTPTFVLAPGFLVISAEHEGESKFVIQILSENGESSDVSVNETGPYTGTRGHAVSNTGTSGLAPGPHRIQITADGDWKLRVEQPVWTKGTPPPGVYVGTGDDVVAALQFSSGIIPLQVTHDGDSNFTVSLVSADGAYTELLANEIGPYAGTIPLQVTEGDRIGLTPGIYGVVVQADGAWTLAFGM